MITSDAFRGRRYAVLGLARSGRATVEALVASGAEVTAWDSDEATLSDFRSSRAQSRGAGMEPEVRPSTGLRTSEVVWADPLEIDLAGFDGVVVSPGVPLNRHPIAGHAREAGVPVIGDIELFALARPSLPAHKVVGITGTNGKSTTTALVHHILKSAGVPTTMGGNIGLPILAQDPLPEGGVYVLELSSYQIDLTFSLDCDVAVLLNVTPDHLDRYASFEAYAASKLRLLAMSTGITERCDQHSEQGRHDVNYPSLKGPHNAQNVRAASFIAGALDLSFDDIVEPALKSFHGLPHRMERVAERGGVVFVNDSKATNADSTAPALAAYPHIHWIVGGRAKTEDLGPCQAQLGHVRAAYTIGESGPMFFRLLDGKVPAVTQSATLDKAVKDAAGAAKAGEVVLLSPACASFDQFRDYEHRGAAFRDAVGALEA